jgi:hypothetical protein
MTRTIGGLATLAIAVTVGCTQPPATPVRTSDTPATTETLVTATMPVLNPRNLPITELRAEFDATDLNGDGIITRSEYGQAFADGNHETMMMREAAFSVNVDLDSDAKVDWDEYQQADRQVPKPVLPPGDAGLHKM